MKKVIGFFSRKKLLLFIFAAVFLSCGLLYKSSPYRMLRPYSLFGRNIPESLGVETKIISGRKAVFISAADPFYIDQIPVTINDYKKCVGADLCDRPHYRDEYEKYWKSAFYGVFPVTFVSWNEARNYCIVNGGDLPSAAQWKAAAGDAKFAWGDSEPNLAKANIDGWYQGHTPAGWLPNGASPYGVLDMNGNVREWVLDENEERNKELKGASFADSWTIAENKSILYHAGFSAGFNRGFRCVYPTGMEDNK